MKIQFLSPEKMVTSTLTVTLGPTMPSPTGNWGASVRATQLPETVLAPQVGIANVTLGKRRRAEIGCRMSVSRYGALQAKFSASLVLPVPP
jgi:hypothetical protein